MNAEELHQTFRRSDYGKDLEQKTRFNDFKPDWVGTELWCDILGDDVNNLRHMPYTLGLTRLFAAHVELAPIEVTKLSRTAITHDWGEAIVGDIALPSKTEEDEKIERVAYREIAHELLDKDVAVDLVDTVVPILDRKGDLGDMFRCIEYIGYYTTHVRAGVQANAIAHGLRPIHSSRPEREQLIGGLLSLNKAVDVSGLDVLKSYVDKHPNVVKVIQAAV